VKGKKILIGICGGIAAYKIPLLVRLLVKAGAEVRIVMTSSAEQFVTRKTLSVLSKNEVPEDFFNSEGNWNNHVELGLWPDLFVIAPATSKTIAKMANGICDNLLLATYLSSRCPVMIAPAMDEDMYLHFSTSENLKKLNEKGAIILPVLSGELASGLHGPGRMTIFERIQQFLNPVFQKKKVLISAGPTHEAIDPVRFIGNRSSGKTGIYLAQAMAALGAEVTLVLGPSELICHHPNITIKNVESAEEMYSECKSHFPSYDIFISAAAVADYRPVKKANEKIKKNGSTLTLELIKNPDILAEAGRLKKQGQVLIGFALETENVLENARKKLADKNLDLIVVNSPNQHGEGFGFDTNRISLLDKHNKLVNFELKHKRLLAFDIALQIATLIR
jgi:phosphopantothenoylcysteine decarboxylase / phosphopantothenate---cysteine ligase